MKKYLILPMALLLALLLSADAMAEPTNYMLTDANGDQFRLYQTGDWQYIIQDGEICLYRYMGTDTNLVLPSQVDEGPLVRMMEFAFNGNADLESVTLPEGFLAIPKAAFQNCTGLKNVVIPSSVTEIGFNAFMNCQSLQNITLPEGLTHLDGQAFCRTALNSVTLPSTLVSMGRLVFDTVGGTLKEVDIPDSVREYTLPIVQGNIQMIVGKDTPLLADILAAGYHNYTVRDSGIGEVGEDAQTVAEKVSAIVDALITPGMSDYDKAIILHDYLIQHAQYDVTLTAEHTHDPEGVLLLGRGVCQSYAEAYRLLLDAVNIVNDFEYGDDHVWNMAKLEGDWYHIDCTWDDPTMSGQTQYEESPASGRESHTYFCVTDEALEGVESHERTERAHEAVSYRLNYAYLNGGLNKRVAEITARIEEAILAGETQWTFAPSSFDTQNMGVDNRLSLQVARDRDFGTEGQVLFRAETACSGEHVTVTLHKIYQYMGELLVAPGDSLRLPGETAWACEGEAVQVNSGLVTALNAGEADVTCRDGAGCALEWRVRVQDMQTAMVCFSLEEEAMAGTGVQRILVAPTAENIGPRAFADCGALLLAVFEGNTEVSPTAFENCGQLVILAPAGSSAAQAADEAGIAWYPIE